MFRCKPSLEGSLAIFNALSIVSLFFVARQWNVPSQLEFLAMIWAFILTFPLAWLFLLPSLSPPTTEQVVLASIMVGLNAIAWGCVVGALLRRTFLSRFDQTTEKGEAPED